MTRCKFTCQSVTKRTNWRKGEGAEPFLYEAEFSAVTDGSEENDQFFDATPNGTLKLGTYKEDRFEPGTDYYLDLAPAR